MRQFREKHLEHGLGGELGDATAAPAKPRFHKFGLARNQWAGQVADDAAAPAFEVTIEVDQNFTLRHPRPIGRQSLLLERAYGVEATLTLGAGGPLIDVIRRA